jgi:hypothetical protein
MPHIRVVIRDVPTMLREILEQVISDEPDMQLIAESSLPAPAQPELHVSPDVVVVGGPMAIQQTAGQRCSRNGHTAACYSLRRGVAIRSCTSWFRVVASSESFHPASSFGQFDRQSTRCAGPGNIERRRVCQ